VGQEVPEQPLGDTPGVATSCDHRAVVQVCNRGFGWARVVDLLCCQNSECSGGEVGGSCGVAGPAADNEAASWVSAFGYFADVVGGEVGGQVGWAAQLGDAWAPVADDGAVVGDDAFAAASFGVVVVEVGAALALACVNRALAVGAAGLASYWSLAAEAGADECLHRGLRRRRAASSRLQLSHRSPQAMRRLQDRQCCSPRLCEPG
jgi:hypothetical protein